MIPDLSDQKSQSLKLERAQQVNQSFCAIANAVNTTLDLDALYQVIHSSLANIIDATNFFIALVNAREKTLHFPYFVDTTDDDFAPISNFDTEDSLTGLVVLHRKPLLLSSEELRKRSENNGVWGPVPLTWMGVPLMVRDEVIGVMAVQSYTNAFTFDLDDLQLFSAISHQTAIAIDRKQSIENLKKSEEKYRNLFHNALVGLFRTQPKNDLLKECNEALAQMLGYKDQEELLAFFSSEIAYVDQKDRIRLFELVRKEGKIENHEVALRKKNGEIGWFRFSTVYYPEYDWIEGVVVDITATKTAHAKNLELQIKLDRSKKMEALGLLAGGVAHDLNNILAGIISYPELLLMKLPDNSELRKPLRTILESGNRAAMIVADMLTIARSAASIKEYQNLHRIIYDYLKSPECDQLKHLYPDIQIQTKFQATTSGLLCSSLHIKKCLMNLVTNGMEAIEGAGKITITTKNTSAALGDELESKDEEETECIVLGVQDTGLGISDENVDHIFEPFYTNKVMGRSGTGLGLAIVWNTTKDHGGIVHVASDGKGTCFNLYFPTTVETRGELPAESLLQIDTGKGESILVVDDELQLRDIAYQILSTLGYSVHTVDSGEKAIDYLKRNKVDLVLLDMLMEPGMNGLQTYEEIIKIHPSQKAIIASGFSKSEDINSALQLGVGNFINKPYSLEKIAQCVKVELSRL